MAWYVEALAIAWSKTYGGKYDDVAYTMVRTSDGGLVLGGIKGGTPLLPFWFLPS